MNDSRKSIVTEFDLRDKFVNSGVNSGDTILNYLLRPVLLYTAKKLATVPCKGVAGHPHEVDTGGDHTWHR